MFYQVFDKGMMRDGEGRDINFRNTVILMTSNLGSETIMQAQAQDITDPKAIIEYIRPELTEHFQAALLARCTIVPFLPLTREVLESVIRLKLGKIEKRLQNSHEATCAYTDAVVSSIAERCSAAEAGARNIDMIINNSLLPKISSYLLANIGEENEDKEKCVNIDADESGEFVITFETDVPVGA